MRSAIMRAKEDGRKCTSNYALLLSLKPITPRHFDVNNRNNNKNNNNSGRSKRRAMRRNEMPKKSGSSRRSIAY